MLPFIGTLVRYEPRALLIELAALHRIYPSKRTRTSFVESGIDANHLWSRSHVKFDEEDLSLFAPSLSRYRTQRLAFGVTSDLHALISTKAHPCFGYGLSGSIVPHGFRFTFHFPMTVYVGPPNGCVCTREVTFGHAWRIISIVWVDEPLFYCCITVIRPGHIK